MEKINSIEDVFGVSRNLPLTYVEREEVEKRLLSSLTREKHIVIHGGSKQGKTCLRKHILQEKDYIVIQCQSRLDLKELYGLILKEAGARIKVSESKTLSGISKVWVQFKAKLAIPFTSSIEGSSQAEAVREESVTTELKEIEIDISDANDVIRILKDMDFNKFIVLEDFHYLEIKIQKEIAIDLKIFHEKSSLSFIVVGVWMEQNRLVLYNGDLTNRVIPINADVWSGDDLHSVISAGESLLNIQFTAEAKTAIISASYNNVGLLQEICWNLCEEEGIYKTQAEIVSIGSIEIIDVLVSKISHEQSGRYRNFIHDFSEGFQHTEHELYKWIMAWLICSKIDDLKTGVSPADMYRKICRTHPNKNRLQMANVTQAFKNLSRLQQKNMFNQLF